jgi:hypothetical protein
VETVLQQEAELRRIQQQFREDELKSSKPHEQRAPQLQNSERKLEPWELAEQRRIQQEQQSFRQGDINERKLEPWELAEQRRIQQEQSLRPLEPWEIAEQRRQEAELRFQDEDFDYVLGVEADRNVRPFPDYTSDIVFDRGQQETAFPKVILSVGIFCLTWDIFLACYSALL